MSERTVRKQAPYSQLLKLQLLATFIVMLALIALQELFGWSREVLPIALSAVVGGFIAILSGAYSVWRAFRNKPNTDKEPSAESVLADMFQAAMGKFLVAGLLLGLTFRFIDYLDPKTLLVTFALVLVLSSLSSLFFFDETAA